MEERIGQALREARKAQGISLRALAMDTGISASLLSQVETGKSQPSVSTLYALVSRLRVSLDGLLGLEVPAASPEGPRRGGVDHAGSGPVGLVIQRASDNPVLNMDSGVRWERLASFDDRLVEALLVTYPGGASSSAEGKLMRHGGFEFAHLLEGSLTLVLEFEQYELDAGDSFCFDSTRPHMYVNRGRGTARGLWYVIGRNAEAHTRERLAELVGDLSGGDGGGLVGVAEVLRRVGGGAPESDG